MVRLNGMQYLIGFIFQICFCKIIVTYLIYLFHTNCNLCATVVLNNSEAFKNENGQETKN